MLKRRLIAILLAAAAPVAALAPVTNAVAAEQTESERLNAFFERVYQENIKRSPVAQSYLGIKTDYDKWDDESDANAIKEFEIAQKDLAEIRTFDTSKLDADAILSYRIFKSMMARRTAAFQYRRYGYVFDQMNGEQSSIPAFLINIHRVTSKSDAEAYVKRLQGVAALMDQHITEAREREKLGILPPKWVYPYIVSDAKNLLTGAPFDSSGKDSTLLEDFKAKVAKLDLPQTDKDKLVADASAALLASVKPAYEKVIVLMTEQEARATNDDGAWKFPDGQAFYNERLKFHTTTDLTAKQIHDLGLSEVARIHGEMRKIMQQVGFKGSLQDFFAYMRDDPRFYYPNTDEGRKDYLAEANRLIGTVKAKLPDFFGTLPNAPLEVKQVEAFREKSAGKAFYQRPAPDGSRPGVYYVNLYNMRDMSKAELEALAYHEGLPGHHLQLAIATELKDVPKFRKFGGFTAYSEGWGLYTEELGKDMGFYQDPYSDFGRLQMELWRACRLVVDSGLHDKRWTREQAIQYLKDNTPNPEGDIVKAIERYIVYPGQATAYLVGKLEIMKLRSEARARLGDKFDIRAFHDAILKSGAVPLDILRENVTTATGGKV